MKNRERSKGLTDDERAAMKERLRELKAEAGGAGRSDGERDLLAKIREMRGPDRALAERVHAIVMASAPTLSPKTWFQRPGEPRRGRHVADRLRLEGADRRRTSENRRPREESSALRGERPQPAR